ncbi:MAG: sensor histidine kinase [Pseudobdellovibrionaceae bacterium]
MLAKNQNTYHTSLFVIISSLIWLLVCQLLFWGVQHSLSKKVINTIQNQFRQELDFSNFHFLSRGLIDYEHSGSVSCILLKKLNPEMVILNRQNSDNCNRPDFLLEGEQVEVILNTLNGDRYHLNFVSRNDILFYSCLWTLRILGIILLLCGFYIYHLSKRAADLKIEKEKSLIEERQMIAKQVAHDIRSPLSALTMVASTLKDIPEDRRVLIRNATQRINDIANDLLERAKTPTSANGSLHSNTATISVDESQTPPESTNQSTEFIPALVDIIISEKRMQYREYAGLEIEVDLKNSFGAFAKVNSNELKRVISNLVNNAVEAFNDFQGKVTVGVRKVDINKSPMIEIFVKDNGRGIPAHLISKLGQAGVSFGKSSSSQSGSGLGLYHAKKTIESFGGDLQIESTEGVGSVIHLLLPLAESPKWFANKIDLTGKKYLVSVDDDISIHQIWAGRLQSLGFNNLEHIKFQSSEAFEQYVNSNINKLRQTFFLVDYELLNQPKTGLDVIEDLGIEKYSILVTSRYEEPAIQERSVRLNLTLLPKALAGFVPMVMAPPKEKYDWVLLDDDDLVHMSWSYAANESNHTLLSFRSPSELEAYKDKLDPDSAIYIDSSLGNNVKGEDVAKKLFDEGFKNLYLATGYSEDQFPHMSFVKGIVGKEPPNTK